MLTVGLGLNWHTLHLNELFCVAPLICCWIIIKNALWLCQPAQTHYAAVRSCLTPTALESSQICTIVVVYLDPGVGRERYCAEVSKGKNENKPSARRLVCSPLRLSKTGTDTCALVLDNFPPPSWIRACFASFFHVQVSNPLSGFNYPALTVKCPELLLWVGHFVSIFMFICMFEASCRLQKESKQKHLFTPLLSRRDLEGGSALGTAIPAWFTPVCSQLVCVCL